MNFRFFVVVFLVRWLRLKPRQMICVGVLPRVRVFFFSPRRSVHSGAVALDILFYVQMEIGRSSVSREE